MTQNAETLRNLVRQLRIELDWVRRTGIVVTPPTIEPIDPAEVIGNFETSRPVGRSSRDPVPIASDPPPPAIDSSPSWPNRAEPPERPSAPPRPMRAAPPNRPWEAYMESSSELEESLVQGAFQDAARADEPPMNRAPSRPSRSRAEEPFMSEGSSSARAEVEEPSTRRGSSSAAMAEEDSGNRGSSSAAMAEVEEPVSLVPGSSRMPRLGRELAAASTLEGVRAVLGDCVRCKLCKDGRRQIVFGVGNPRAELMFVGEGPGADEDRMGEPFVGKAGQLLTRIIEDGMGLARSDVYIANIVKCRPRNNRDPEPDEVAACEPFLQAQIRVIKPRVLVALGRYSAHTLLRTQTPITRLRGKWGEYKGIPLMPTYHPAYLLRNPAEKRAVWKDIQEVMHFLGIRPKGSGAAS